MKRLKSKGFITLITLVFFLASFGVTFAFWASSISGSTTVGSGNVAIGTWPPPGAIIVSNATEFNNIRNNLNGNYWLTQDIHLTGNFTPIGSESSPFTGNLYGNGKKITGLNITTSNSTNNNDYSGLFGVNTGLIKDLNIIGMQLNYTYSATASGNNTELIRVSRIGGLVGLNSGSIYNVYVQGQITSHMTMVLQSNGQTANITSSVGGLVGRNQGTIANAHAHVTLSNTTSNTRNNFPNNLKVLIENQTGGLVGYVHSGSVLNSYSQGSVQATSSIIRGGGGNALNTVNLHIGGFAGRNDGTVISNFTAASAQASVSVQDQASTATNTIYHGVFLGRGSANNTNRRLTGLSVSITGQTPLANSSDLSVTRTEAQLKSALEIFDVMGWTSDVWSIDGINYPRLKNNNY